MVAGNNRKPGVLGPDGVLRGHDEEHKLNLLFAAAFERDAGREALRHLRAITIEAVAGPGVSPDALMHREGMRYLVGIIEQRIARGRNG